MASTSNNFLNNLKAHRAFRVATVYAIGGWLLIQFADITLEAFAAPTWIMQSFLMFVLAGFPLAVAGTWLLSRSELSGRSNTLITLGSLGLAVFVSVLIYGYFGEDQASLIETNTESVVQGVRNANPVIAVLPFTNMSSQNENEFLADGMTEDIITLLAQSPGLDVIARNSTFKYKNTSPDIREVGSDLGAEYVVEGSIRPIGDRIRVTVQVIESETGAHTWAEKFDRSMNQFFSVQDDVSLGVAAAVGDAVFREEYDKLKQSRTKDLTAWALVHKADRMFNLGLDAGDALEKARQAISLDPGYALAYAVLGRGLSAYTVFEMGFKGHQAELNEAEEAARKALSLAPDDPKVLTFLAITLLWTGQPVEALAFAKKSVDLSPSYAEGQVYYGDILTHNGRSREAIAHFDKAIRLTPNAPQLGIYYSMLGEALLHHRDFENAERALIQANRIQGRNNQLMLRYLAGAQLRLGKTQQALETLLEAQALIPDRPVSFESDAMAFYSTDDGGDEFISLWQELAELQMNSPAQSD